MINPKMNQAPALRRSSREHPGPPPRDDELVAGRRARSIAGQSRQTTTWDLSDEDVVGEHHLVSTKASL